MKEKYDFNDILIQTAISSSIESRRSQVNNLYEGSTLPIFVSPMDTVIDYNNYRKFVSNNLNVCLPRGENYVKTSEGATPFIFNSVSLSFIDKAIKENIELVNNYLLIDIANGHMLKLEKMVREFKEKYPQSVLMVGNIANPKTYRKLSLAGADFIRVGIGFGSGCLTTEKTGVGYPMASLVRECYEEKCKIESEKAAKIVADGGFKKESDIIKALALGADYVMLGGMFNRAIESAGDNYIFKYLKVSNKIAKKAFERGYTVRKSFRGMSTKEVQRKWGNRQLKTSEGVKRMNKVEYTLSGWCENFSDYLKSAMSYTNSNNLEDFIGKVKYNKISSHSFKRFTK